jgi:hypothetical protein
MEMMQHVRTRFLGRGDDRGRGRRPPPLRQRTPLHGVRWPATDRALERQQSASRLDHQDRQ